MRGLFSIPYSISSIRAEYNGNLGSSTSNFVHFWCNYFITKNVFYRTVRFASGTCPNIVTLLPIVSIDRNRTRLLQKNVSIWFVQFAITSFHYKLPHIYKATVNMYTYINKWCLKKYNSRNTKLIRYFIKWTVLLAAMASSLHSCCPAVQNLWII
jgi:hypothetical protein